MSDTINDACYQKVQGTGEHTCNFRCFDTIGRMICCYCGALAYPEDLVRQGMEDIKAGKYRNIEHSIRV